MFTRSAGRTAKWTVTLLVVAGLLGLTMTALAAGGLSVGSKAPAFTLKTLDGKTFKLANYRGKSVVLLDFGRFTCMPCRSVLGDLQKLQAQYGGKGVQIFHVNLDGPLAGRVVPKGIRELGIRFPVLLDRDAKIAAAYKVEVIPHLVLVDTRGKVRYTHTGYEEGLRAKLVEQIDKYRPR